MTVLLFVGAAVLFGMLALRFGADTRDGDDWHSHCRDTLIHC